MEKIKTEAFAKNFYIRENYFFMRLFLLVFIMSSFTSFSQDATIPFPIDSSTRKINFSEVIKVDNADAKTLYSRAKLFVANSFKSAKDVTQLEDDATNTIVGKGIFVENIANLGQRGDGYVSFKFSIECRDKRYKYSFTDFEHHAARANGAYGGPLENEKAAAGGLMFPKKFWDKMKLNCYDRIQNIVAALKTSMNSINQKNDW